MRVVAELAAPGPDPEVVQFLVKERDVIGFGTESASQEVLALMNKKH